MGAVFVAVADEKEFLDNFEVVKAGDKINEVKPKTNANTYHPTIYLAIRNGYAVIADEKDRAAVEAAVEAKQDISAEMAGLESWLAENDGTIVGTAAGIKYAAKYAGEELKKSKDGAAPAQWKWPHCAPSWISTARPWTAMPSEISLAVAGIRCDKQGSIRVIGRARLVNGGQVSKAVAGIPPAYREACSPARRAVRSSSPPAASAFPSWLMAT